MFNTVNTLLVLHSIISDLTLLQMLHIIFSSMSYFADGGSNMIAALHGEERLDCTAHILNTVLRHSFDDKKDCPPEVTELLVILGI